MLQLSARGLLLLLVLSMHIQYLTLASLYFPFTVQLNFLTNYLVDRKELLKNRIF